MISGRAEWHRRIPLELASFVIQGAGQWLRPLADPGSTGWPRGDRREVAEAVYGSLVAAEITYDREQFQPDPALQTVKLPPEILAADRTGTCLDLALLYAGLCMGRNLLPIVVVQGSHALVLVCLTHDLHEYDSYDRPGFSATTDGMVSEETIRSLIDDRSFIAVECTGFAAVNDGADNDPVFDIAKRVDGCLPFERAVEIGTRQVKEQVTQYGIDIAVAQWTSGIRAYSIAGPADTVVAQKFTSYGEFSRRKQRQLRFDAIRFADPGDDTSPTQLLARISDDQQGILLIGPAGSGKTRTCLEVAMQATSDWRVLFAQENAALTNDDLRHAVLDYQPARALVILDYLESHIGLDFEDLAEVLIPEAAERGTKVAFLATCLPGWLAHRRSDTRLLFRHLPVRTDEQFGRAVTRNIVRGVANDSLTQLSMRSMQRICGARPAIALLIALQMGKRIRAGEYNGRAEHLHSSKLITWLRRRLEADGVPMSPQRAAQRSNFRVPSPAEAEVQCCATAAASTPDTRVLIEATVRLVSDAIELPPGADPLLDASSFVDRLIELGWLDYVDDTLDVVHDAVTDELLREVFFPNMGGVLHRESALRVLDAVGTSPSALAHFATHLSRLYEGLTESGDDSQLAQRLKELCAAWIEENAQRLGQMLESTTGGRTLYKLLHEPWRGPVSEHWDTVVAPWFSGTPPEDQARLLTAEIRASGPDRQPSAVPLAAVWLSGHSSAPAADQLLHAVLTRAKPYEHGAAEAVDHVRRRLEADPHATDTNLLLTALLRREDIDENVRDWAIETALTRSQRNSTALTTGTVLCALLEQAELSDDQQEDVISSAVTWLHRWENSLQAMSVLQRLVKRHDLTADRKREFVNDAMTWLGRKLLMPRAVDLLRDVLEVQGLTRQQRIRVSQQAVRWLKRNPDSRSASRVLSLAVRQSLISSTVAEPPQTAAFEWLSTHCAQWRSGYVLYALLRSRYLIERKSENLRKMVFEWLAVFIDDTDAVVPAGWVIRGLLFREDLTATQAKSAIDYAAKWLRSNPNEPKIAHALREELQSRDRVQGWDDPVLDFSDDWMNTPPETLPNVLYEKLRSTELDPEQSDVVVDHALAWLDEHGLDREAARPLNGLLRRRNLAADAANRVIMYAIGWLDCNHKEEAARSVVAGLLWRSDLIHGQARRSIYYGFYILQSDRFERKMCHFYEELLPRPELTIGEASDLLLWAIEWLERNPDSQDQWRVLWGLLLCPQQRDRTRRYCQEALTWLADWASTRQAGFVIEGLMSRNDLTDADARTVVDQALKWLERYSTEIDAAFVMYCLLGRPEIDSTQAEHVVDLMRTWLTEHPARHDSTVHVLMAMLKHPGLTGGERRGKTHAALAWLIQHPHSHHVPTLITVLRDFGDLDEPVRLALDAPVEQCMTMLTGLISKDPGAYEQDGD